MNECKWMKSCLTRVLGCWGWSSPVDHTPESQRHTVGRKDSWYERACCHPSPEEPSGLTHLQDDACGLVEVHHLFDNWLEELAVTWMQQPCLRQSFHGQQHETSSHVWRETHSGHRCHLSEERSDSNTCRSLLPLHTCHLSTTHTSWSTAWTHNCLLAVGIGFSRRSLCSGAVESNVNSTCIQKCLWGRTSILGRSADSVLGHAGRTHENTLSCFYLFLGKSSCHICGKTQSWRGRSSKRPPVHHHRGECRCQCRELWGGIWKAPRIKKEAQTRKKNECVCLTLAAPVCWWLCHLRNKNQMPTDTNPVYGL